LEEASTHQRTASQGWAVEDNEVENNERRELEAFRLLAKTQRAIATLENHQKALAQECGERRKRLRRIIAAIQQRDQLGMLPIEGIDKISVGVEDEALIHNPMQGL
jgi:hypothetical protein